MKKIFFYIVILAVGIGVISFLVTVRKGNQEIEKSSATPWKTYQSEEFGFSISHPNHWQIQEKSTQVGREVWLMDPDTKDFILIVGAFEPALQESGGLEKALLAVEQSMRQSDQLRVHDFKKDIQGEIGGYLMSGEMYLRGKLHRITEKGLLAKNGRVLFIRSGVHHTALERDQQVIHKITDSFVISE